MRRSPPTPATASSGSGAQSWDGTRSRRSLAPPGVTCLSMPGVAAARRRPSRCARAVASWRSNSGTVSTEQGATRRWLCDDAELMVPNPFLGLEHRRPDVDPDEAARLLHAGWGRTGVVRELGSHQDRNFLVEDEDGRYVLKVARHGISRVELEAENAAMRHASAA